MRPAALVTLAVVVAVVPAAMAASPADTKYELGVRYKENGRYRDADRMFKEAIELDPNHEEARAELGYVRAGDRWVKPKADQVVYKGRLIDMEEAFVQAEKFYQRSYYKSLGGMCKAIVAGSPGKNAEARCQVYRALVYERKGKWEKAIEVFGAVARMADDPGARRQKKGSKLWVDPALADVVRAHMQVLQEHPDGMYTMTKGGKTDLFSLDDSAGKADQGGKETRSLKEREVMNAALREKSKEVIEQGRRKLKRGEKAETESGKEAGKLYEEALQKFAAAESIATGTARSFQIEATRKLIGLEQKRYVEAYRYADAALGGMGSSRAIRRKLAAAAKRLEECEEACERILELAKPYHEELKTHINQAKENRERTEHIKRKLRSISAAFK